MLNDKPKKIYFVFFLLISLILFFGCSSGKPSEETIKSVIKQRLLPMDKNNVCYIKDFKITKEFNKKVAEEDFYCIEVSFEMMAKQKPADKVIWVQNKTHWRFIKRDDKWQGFPGWPM
jgi:hypothetical protein